MTTSSGYEFNEHENGIFKNLVTGMRRAGITVAVGSSILLAYQVVQYFGVSLKTEPSALAYHFDVGIWCLIACVGVIVAALLVRATAGFHAVIHTQGDDIKHLMSGLERLCSIVNLIFWTSLFGSALLGLSFVLLLSGKA